MIRNELPYSKEDYYVGAQGNPELNIDITANGDYDVRKYSTAKVNVSGGGDNSYTIKTIACDKSTHEPINNPNLFIDVHPSFIVNFIYGDEPYMFELDDDGSISLLYKDYETDNIVDTIILNAKYPITLSRMTALVNDNALQIDGASFNDTAVNFLNGFNIEESGTLKVYL